MRPRKKGILPRSGAELDSHLSNDQCRVAYQNVYTDQVFLVVGYGVGSARPSYEVRICKAGRWVQATLSDRNKLNTPNKVASLLVEFCCSPQEVF